MYKSDIENYPKLYQYVSVKIPEVAKIDVIIKQIQKFSGDIALSRIKDALIWGKGPKLNVLDLDGAFGEFSPGIGSNELRIDSDMVEEFEAGKGLRRTPTGKMVYLVGVTILHELTHWADDQDGVDTEGEEGEHFENAVYGGVIV